MAGSDEAAARIAQGIDWRDSPDAVRLEWLRRAPGSETALGWSEPQFLAELGRSPQRDRLLLEWAATQPISEARQLLGAAALLVERDDVAPPTAALLQFHLGRVGTLEDAPRCLVASLSADPDEAAFARNAFERLIAEAIRNDAAPAVAILEARLAEAYPGVPSLWLDTGAARALAGGRADARDAFARAAAGTAFADDTVSLLRRGAAELGQRWLATMLDAPFVDDASAPNRRAALPHEDEIHALDLRGEFVTAIVSAAKGSLDRTRLAAALATAEVDASRCLANEAWFGASGPLFGRQLLRQAGRGETWLPGALAIVDAIEASHGRHGHGLLGRSTEDDEAEQERPAAWCFLAVAESLLIDGGDPAAARALLEPRRAPLAATTNWSNHELACETELMAARIELYSGNARAATIAADAALRLARELHAGTERDRRERQIAGEIFPPPTAHVVGRDDSAYSGLVARGLSTRAAVRATLVGDTRGAAEDLYDAGAYWPWDAMRWLRHATDYARRGRIAAARACVARVEARPEHAYDLACVHALCGESEAAIARLAEHLAWAGRTPAARKLEIEYAARDRDLAALRDDPRFPRR
ncbi:MAG: hypothetical protein EXS13_03740 [Planctomycetes bacterium]|nr:hypothetical protein [Planctomycetota bacterium]